MKICLEAPNLLKLKRKYQAFYVKTCMLHIVGRDMYSATIQRMLAVLPWQSFHIYYFADSDMYVNIARKALLHFHGNSGYANITKCYIILHCLPFLSTIFAIV